jgi:hypothetical protein
LSIFFLFAGFYFSMSSPSSKAGSVALTGAHATRSYRCCTSGSNIEQLVDELNFAGDLGLAEEAMAADYPHDFKSLDGGRRCSHRLKTAGGTDHPLEATVICLNNVV